MTTEQPPRVVDPEFERQRKLYRRIAIGTVIACPVIALLPPRRLNLYTACLGATMAIAGNHLSRDSTGLSLLQLVAYKVTPSNETSFPTERAREVHEALKGIKQRSEAEKALLKQQEEEEKQKRGVLEQIWMGGEGKDWKVKRDLEEQEALDQGKGIWDMIVDQVEEVWNGGKKKEEEEEEDTKPTDKESKS